MEVEMSTDNKELQKKIRGQIARRCVDASMVNVHVIGGTVQLTGVLKIMREHANLNLKEEMENISKLLRAMPGVRDVVWDVTLRT
jgi:osmotically-inducible protein OsmY